MSELNWLFLDLNSYFASVEQQERPELRGRPMAVVPVLSDSSCAIAASYEAKAFGITTGTRIYEAKRLCPDLRLVPARHDLYVDYHHRILEAIDRHIPVTKAHSVDEVACRLMGNECAPAPARALAQAVKDGIQSQVGACLRSSVGLAPNRYLAKVGTELEKPDGLVTLTAADLPYRLYELSLRDLPGIGGRMEPRLHAAGITTVRDLMAREPKELRAVWGNVMGERLYYWLRGADFDLPDNARRSVGHSRVLAPDMRAPAQARLVARRLMAKAAGRLRHMGLAATGLLLSARLEQNGKWARQRRIPAARDTLGLLRALDELWPLLDDACGPGARIKKIGIGLSGLTPPDKIAPDLFSYGDWRRTARQLQLSEAMDRLNTRYGRETVAFGPCPGGLDYAGTKIAFTRIPDRAEFAA